MSACVCACVNTCVGAFGGHGRNRISWSWSHRKFVSHTACMLGTEPESSERAASTLNH